MGTGCSRHKLTDLMETECLCVCQLYSCVNLLNVELCLMFCRAGWSYYDLLCLENVGLLQPTIAIQLKVPVAHHFRFGSEI